VRYNGEEGRVGTPDHYYTSEPLPSSWGKKMIRKVLAQKIELGMTDRQVRISIGNPMKYIPRPAAMALVNSGSILEIREKRSITSLNMKN